MRPAMGLASTSLNRAQSRLRRQDARILGPTIVRRFPRCCRCRRLPVHLAEQKVNLNEGIVLYFSVCRVANILSGRVNCPMYSATIGPNNITAARYNLEPYAC